MVMDDLEVKPLSTLSMITLLDKFNVKEIGTLVEKVVNFGMDEVCSFFVFLLILEVLGVFWSFFGFWGYFGHI